MKDEMTVLTAKNIFTGESREFTEILQGFTITETADGNANSACIMFQDKDKTPIPSCSVVEVPFRPVEKNYKTKRMLIIEDNVVSRGVYPGHEFYRHTLLLMEQSVILDKIFVQNLTLTNLENSLLYQLQRVCKNALPVIDGRTSPNSFSIKLSEGLSDITTFKKGEDFFFEEATLHEVFKEMLSAIGIRPHVESIESGVITVGYIDPTAIQSYRDIPPYAHYESRNYFNELCGKIHMPISNGRTKTVVTQGPMRFFNASDDNNYGEMMLQYPAEEVVKFSLRLPSIEFKIRYKPLNAGEHLKNISLGRETEIDATKYIVDKEYYDTFSEEEKKNYLYYERGNTSINASETVKNFLFTNKTFTQIAQNAAKDYSKIVEQIVRAEIVAQYGDNLESFEGIDVKSYNIGTVAPWYTITYIPQVNADIESIKPVSCSLMADLTIPDNQSDGTPDTSRLGRNLQNRLNNVGNAMLYYDCDVKDCDELIPLQSIVAGMYYVYQRDLSIFDRFIKVRYYLAEGYNAYAERTGIDRQKRIYTIPLSGTECRLKFNSYIQFSTAEPNGTNCDLSDTHMDAFAKSLVGQKVSARPNKMYVKTSWEERSGTIDKEFELATAGFGAGTALNWYARFYDNYSAGLSNYKENTINIDSKMIKYNPYCNNIGEFHNIRVQLMQGRDNLDAAVEFLPVSSYDYYGNGNKVTDIRTCAYTKDRLQSIAVQYIIHLRPTLEDRGRIVIGAALSECNNLMQESADGLSVKVSDTAYAFNAVIAKGVSQGNISQFSCTHDFAKKYATLIFNGESVQCNAWAICDGQNNLLLAVNGALTNGTKVYIVSKKNID